MSRTPPVCHSSSAFVKFPLSSSSANSRFPITADGVYKSAYKKTVALSGNQRSPRIDT